LTERRSAPGAFRLRLDIATARLLVWVAAFGREAELMPHVHRYFADRYFKLAEVYRDSGRPERALRLARRAQDHVALAGDDEPPEPPLPPAAAVGVRLPGPRGLTALEQLKPDRDGGALWLGLD